MTEAQFYKKLSESKIDSRYVCFNDVVRDDVFSVREYYGQFEVCYRERGKEYNLRRYNSFAEIIQYLKNEMHIGRKEDFKYTENECSNVILLCAGDTVK